MIRANIKMGDTVVLQATGNMIEITSDIAVLIDKIYESLKESNSMSAEAFKYAIREVVTNGPIMDNSPDKSKESSYNEIHGEEW